MATVPGTPNVVPMLPEWAKPTQADFLQAAAIMHERDNQRVMFDPTPMNPGKTPNERVMEGQQEFEPGYSRLWESRGASGGTVMNSRGQVLRTKKG